MRTLSPALAALTLLALLAPACGGGTDGSKVNGSDGNGNGVGSNGGGVVLNPNGGNGPSSGSGTVIDPGDACATGTANASLSGVNMFVMFDRSSSMNQPVGRGTETRWSLTSAALTDFFKSPDASGLELALRFFPHDTPAMGCNNMGCNVAACGTPLVPLGALTAEAAPTDAQEAALVAATMSSAPGMAGQGTPISAALDGALRWASAQHKATPSENSVVVLVTDGQANGCQEDIAAISKLAADALAADGTRTYAIGLTGSNNADMNRIAMAGGTAKGIFVADGANTKQDLLDALGAIRGQVLDCDFPMPEAKAGLAVNPAQINVNFTPSSGAKSTLAQVADEAGCTNAQGWYYDNPLNPTRIILCKSTCDSVTADPMAALEILLGCATVTNIPK